MEIKFSSFLFFRGIILVPVARVTSSLTSPFQNFSAFILIFNLLRVITSPEKTITASLNSLSRNFLASPGFSQFAPSEHGHANALSRLASDKSDRSATMQTFLIRSSERKLCWRYLPAIFCLTFFVLEVCCSSPTVREGVSSESAPSLTVGLLQHTSKTNVRQKIADGKCQRT